MRARVLSDAGYLIGLLYRAIEHTAFAREHLGAEPFLGVEMTAVFTTDAEEGRRIGRAFARNYLKLPNYANWPGYENGLPFIARRYCALWGRGT